MTEPEREYEPAETFVPADMEEVIELDREARKMTEPTKRKWTGGEWRIHAASNQTDEEGNPVINIVTPFGKYTQVVAVVYSESKSNREANAHILAAAKKLFEACHESNVYFKGLVRNGIIKNMPSMVGRLQAALSAALGESTEPEG